MSALRLEFTEEMAKIYDKVYAESSAAKGDEKKKTKKGKTPESLY